MYIKKLNTQKKKTHKRRVSAKEELNKVSHLQSWSLPSRGLPEVVLSMAAVMPTTLLLPDLGNHSK